MFNYNDGGAPIEPGLGAPAAAPPVAPAAAPAQQQAPPLTNDPTANALNFWRDPQRLALAAASAAATQDPDLMKWIARGHAAAQENTGEALAKLVAGDTAGAIAAFNANGTQKAVRIDPGSGKGTYKITMADGSARDIDPKKELTSLLVPSEIQKAWDREDVTATRAQGIKDTLDERYRGEVLRSQDRRAHDKDLEALREAQAKLAEARAAQAQAKADNTGGAPAEKPITSKEIEKKVMDAASQVKDLRVRTKYGKEESYEPKALAQIKSLAGSIILAEPTIPSSVAVQRAEAMFAESRSKAEASAVKEADAVEKEQSRKWNSPSTWSGNIDYGKDVSGKPLTREQFIAKRTDEESRVVAPAASGKQTAVVSPKSGAAPSGGYPDGTKLKDKAGKQYIVKNGIPVPL
jgi:hypothetical protein